MHECTPLGEECPRAGGAARSLLSLKEVVILADVAEKRVRKDIETGVLAEPRIVRLSDSRLAFGWHCVLFVAAVYGNDHLNGRLRKLALSKLDQLVPTLLPQAECLEDSAMHAALVPKFLRNSESFCREFRLHIDHYVSLDLERALHNVSPRMSIYSHGLSRSEERSDTLGGEAVFGGSRLSVLHVGKMVESGEEISNILEDYPYLNEDDIRFAELYYRAHPTVGRPRASGGAGHAEVVAG